MARSDPNTTTLPLGAAVNLVGMAIERRSTIPILCRAKIAADRSGASIEGTDLDNTVRVALAIGLPKCATTIDHQALSRAVKATGAETIALDVAKKVVTIGDNPTVTLPLVDDADEFPVVKLVGETKAFALDAADLATDLARVSPAISTEETRYYLNGVMLNSSDRLRLHATDGHRLHLATRAAPAGIDALPEAIIPRRTVKIIRAALAAQPKAASVECEFGVSAARFVIGAVEIIAKLIDGTYPDVTRVIRKEHAGYIDVAPSAIARPAKVAQDVIGDQTVCVALRPLDGKVHAKSPKGVSLTAEFDREVTGKPCEAIGFRPQYLIDLLSGFEADTVRLSFETSAAGPMEVTSEDESFMAVLMPMRI